MDLIEVIESKRFLGPEFLTWLWFRCDNGQGRFDLSGGESLGLAFDDHLMLEGYLSEAEQSRITGGAPAQSPEAKSALRSGKRVSRARLILVVGEDEWVFTVTADRFSFSSVKLPMMSVSAEDRTLERLRFIDDLGQHWSALYRQFLEQRLSDEWPSVSQEMTNWAAAS